MKTLKEYFHYGCELLGVHQHREAFKQYTEALFYLEQIEKVKHKTQDLNSKAIADNNQIMERIDETREDIRIHMSIAESAIAVDTADQMLITVLNEESRNGTRMGCY